MPYIETKTTVKATCEQERLFKEALGKAIEIIPGKSEAWLMLNLIDGCRMSFKGDADTDCAMVEIDIFGSAECETYDAMTEAVCNIVNEIFGIKKDRIYVKYRECDTWGYNGFNF